jgi:hypothetical protein
LTDNRGYAYEETTFFSPAITEEATLDARVTDPAALFGSLGAWIIFIV